MKRNIRVALSFATLPAGELNSFGILVGVCLKNNPLFPDLPMTLAVLAVLQMALQNAITAAAQGGVIETAAKDEAFEDLASALRQIAAYVQSLGLEAISDVLSSGFDIVGPRRASGPLDVPVVLGLNNAVSTQLGVRLQAVVNARAYQAQFRSGTGTWQEGGIFGQSRGITLADLAPGTVYVVRVRAIGGATNVSDWSASISLMAT